MTKGVNPATEAAAPFLAEKQKAVALGICREDNLSAIATRDDLIKTTSKMDAWFAGHEAFIASKNQSCLLLDLALIFVFVSNICLDPTPAPSF